MKSTGTLLVSLQGLNKGQTLNLIGVKGILAQVKPDGYNGVYSIPIKYIKQPNEDLEFPRCQEIYELWTTEIS